MRTSQSMANIGAGGRSTGGSSSGSSVMLTARPNGNAKRMKELVDEWEKEHGPLVRRQIHNAFLQPLPEDNEHSDNLADETDGDSTSKRKGRGRAQLWDGWGDEKKIIELDKHNNYLGENGAKLASHLGKCARNGNWFPLDWTSWDGMKKEALENIWKDVKANTNAPDGFKKLCFKKLNKSWKSFKYELKKKYFTPFKDNPEHCFVVPPEVQPDQWSELVSYWSMESTQEISMRNMDNRGNLNAYPRIGRNSIPNIVHKRKENNEPTDGISIWRATRAKKGKFTEDDGAAGINEQFERRLDELPEEEKDDPEKRERIFVDIIGNDGHGRVLCGGVGTRLVYTSPATLDGTSHSSIQDFETDLAKLREELAERDRRIEEHDRRIAERDLERDLRDAARDRYEEEMRSEMASLKALLQVTQRSAMDSEARVIQALNGAGINSNFVLGSTPIRGNSSGRSNTRNQLI